jgi:hypothetical protein
MHECETTERLAIEDVASIVDRAVDEKRWDELGRHFTATVAFDVAPLGSSAAVQLARADFVQAIAGASPPDKRTFHTRSNVLTSVNGNRASMEARSYGWNECAAFDPPVYEVWGVMNYEFERIDGRWLIGAVRMRKWREAGNRAVNEHSGT